MANRYFRFIYTPTKIFRREEEGEEEEGRKGRKKRHADEGATMPGGERAASNKGVTKLSGKKGKGEGEKKKGEKDGNLSR